MRIDIYQDKDETMWDDFVLNQAVNGTFLQTRRFLNYHKPGKFDDASILFFNDKNNLMAVCPACTVEGEQNKRIFFSHKGSTFGGLIIMDKYYKTHYLLELIEMLKTYLLNENYDEAYLKITPSIFSKDNDDLLSYCLQYNNWYEYKEISTYIDYEHYKDDIISNLAQGKRTNVHNCVKQGVELKELDEDEQIIEFYDILSENLLKYDAKPVHTIDELLEFKKSRLKDEVGFYGLFLDGKMIAASMMFYFHNSQTAHTQYLAARQEYNTLSPMSFLYYSMIVEMKNKKFKKLSWGIATEDLGRYLNISLITSKENYGSRYSTNSIYYINLRN